MIENLSIKAVGHYSLQTKKFIFFNSPVTLPHPAIMERPAEIIIDNERVFCHNCYFETVWNYDGRLRKISFEAKTWPTKDFSSLAAIYPPFNDVHSFPNNILIYDKNAELIAIPEYPWFGYGKYLELKAPGISMAWFTEEETIEIKKNTGLTICIETDIKFVFWLDEDNEAWSSLQITTGCFTHVFFKQDHGRHLDQKLNEARWFKQ